MKRYYELLIESMLERGKHEERVENFRNMYITFGAGDATDSALAQAGKHIASARRSKAAAKYTKSADVIRKLRYQRCAALVTARAWLAMARQF